MFYSSHTTLCTNYISKARCVRKAIVARSQCTQQIFRHSGFSATHGGTLPYLLNIPPLTVVVNRYTVHRSDPQIIILSFPNPAIFNLNIYLLYDISKLDVRLYDITEALCTCTCKLSRCKIHGIDYSWCT